MNLIVRSEQPKDESAIRAVNEAAFGREDEAKLVDALRDQGFARLSLVAVENDEVVGHILFSVLHIVDQKATDQCFCPRTDGSRTIQTAARDRFNIGSSEDCSFVRAKDIASSWLLDIQPTILVSDSGGVGTAADKSLRR